MACSPQVATDFALLSLSSSRVFPDKSSLMLASFDLASEIASRSPVAVQGTKINLIYSRDHSVQESLDYMVSTNLRIKLPGAILLSDPPT